MDLRRRAMLGNAGPSGRRDGGDALNAQNQAKYLSSDEQSRQFVAGEDTFVLGQAKKKADIRVREGRAKPIDHLAFSIRYIEDRRDIFDDQEDDVDIELKDPAIFIESLTRSQIAELMADIGSFLTLEVNPLNRRYWQALRGLCDYRELNLDPIRREEKARVQGMTAGDWYDICKKFNLEEIVEHVVCIKKRLADPNFMDRDFNQCALDDLLFFKAKREAEPIFAKMLEAREKLIKERGPVTKPQPKPAASSSYGEAFSAAADGPDAPSTALVTAVGNEDTSLATKALYDREAAQGLLDNEELFTTEAVVPDPKRPDWAVRYKPRKPRYFNRVQMGYEWNKYNQTHFDHDHPPPKVVQGYRFNIFYPDLLDITKTPTYKLFRENGRKRGESLAPAGEEDTCLIIFKAGPPYEDIAFRIVDRQWDFSAKKERGFKSTYDKVSEGGCRATCLRDARS